MAYYEGAKPDMLAGRMIEILNETLLLNAHWTKVDDTANGMAANSAVYRCQDSPIDFYMKVDNNYTSYSFIELWESWDSGTHTGSGNSLTFGGTSTTYYLRLLWPSNSYAIRVTDRNFSFIYTGGNMGHSFIGAPDEIFDATKNIVMYVGRSTGTTEQNPFGYGTDASNIRVCRSLFDELGNSRAVFKLVATGPITTIGGAICLDETKVVNVDTNLAVGIIRGNACCGENVLTAYGGNIYQIQGKQWMVIGRSIHYNSLVLKE